MRFCTLSKWLHLLAFVELFPTNPSSRLLCISIESYIQLSGMHIFGAPLQRPITFFWTERFFFYLDIFFIFSSSFEWMLSHLPWNLPSWVINFSRWAADGQEEIPQHESAKPAQTSPPVRTKFKTCKPRNLKIVMISYTRCMCLRTWKAPPRSLIRVMLLLRPRTLKSLRILRPRNFVFQVTAAPK